MGRLRSRLCTTFVPGASMLPDADVVMFHDVQILDDDHAVVRGENVQGVLPLAPDLAVDPGELLAGVFRFFEPLTLSPDP